METGKGVYRKAKLQVANGGKEEGVEKERRFAIVTELLGGEGGEPCIQIHNK